jgi:hypothetical protein
VTLRNVKSYCLNLLYSRTDQIFQDKSVVSLKHKASPTHLDCQITTAELRWLTISLERSSTPGRSADLLCLYKGFTRSTRPLSTLVKGMLASAHSFGLDMVLTQPG